MLVFDDAGRMPVDVTPGWNPTPDAINALPDPVRKYIHDLETRCDPAGIVAENTLLRDRCLQFQAQIENMRGGE